MGDQDKVGLGIIILNFEIMCLKNSLNKYGG
jgi:hypothetical protein